MLWRLHAQRLLVERGQHDVVPQLLALVAQSRRSTRSALNGGALHALWTLDGLGAVTDAHERGRTRGRGGALKHPAAGVRKAAATVLPRDAGGGRAILEAGLLRDPDLHTRLAAVLALADACPRRRRSRRRCTRRASSRPTTATAG